MKMTGVSGYIIFLSLGATPSHGGVVVETKKGCFSMYNQVHGASVREGVKKTESISKIR